MKKIQSIFILLALLMSFTACDDNNDSDGTASVNGTFIKKVYPNNIVTGQTIIITGNNFDPITEVILPGNIAVTNFERVGFNQISVIAPEGLVDGYVVLKAGDKEILAPNAIKAVVPTFTRLFPAPPDTVSIGELVTIKGENLIEIQQVIIGTNLVIDALHFKRKSDTEIKLIIPAEIKAMLPEGQSFGNFEVKMVTIAGTDLMAQEIVVKDASFVEPSLIDPITANTIILMDFEEHGGHNGGWDNSWGGNTEIVKDDKTGNTYLRTTADIAGNWILNCNHQSNIGTGATWPWTVTNVENYVVKFDILIPSTVDGSAAKGLQFILADQWKWYGDGLLAETVKGEWVTVRVPMTQWADFTGAFDFSSATNGLSGTMPAGVCIDNYRVDPK
jgi:hypothetical protein